MRAITVSQLNNYIRQIFEAESLLHGIEVIGEIEGISNRGNATYFSLRDEGAVIQCVCYTPTKLRGIANGTQVSARGTVGFWHKAGKINFTVGHVEKFGLGQLFLKLKELQDKLAKEGYFDTARKKALPTEIKRIGIVTSKQGAVIHDIIKVAHRRNPSIDMILYPVQVQGIGAESSIAEAIRFFNNQVPAKAEFLEDCTPQGIDVIIVARGGGSKDELETFNTEIVARAVFESKIPIVSAVGHETDWTLVDFVADLRAATPSAAAELCVAEVTTKRDQVTRLWNFLKYLFYQKLEKATCNTITSWRECKSRTLSMLDTIQGNIEQYMATISAHNPIETLKRGYAKLSIISTKEAKIGDKLTIKMYDGEITAEIKEIQLWEQIKK